MCQLSLIHLNDEYLNKVYLWGQSFSNTLTDHKDGFGYFTEGYGVYKFMTPPSLCTNAGELISNNFMGNSPVISHVRKASYSAKIPKPENIVIANVHPFETKHFIFAHNGTLEFKDEKRMDEKRYEEMIDTKIFLSRFEEMYLSKNKSFASSLKSTMEEFTGKFAFLIYEKLTKKYFVVRGDTANLFHYKIIINDKPVGFVVNTDRDSLVKGLLYFTNSLQLNRIGSIKFDEKDISLLEKESIFYLDRRGTGSLKKVDSIVENKKGFKTYTTSRENDDTWYNRNMNHVGKNLDLTQTRLYKFCADWNISEYYLSEIILSTLGVSLLESEEEDLKTIANIIIPAIEERAKKGPKKIKKAWNQLMNKTYKLDVSVHRDSEIEFPYMLETDIRKIRDYTEKTVRMRGVH